MKSIKLVTINDCVVFLEFFKKNCNICVLGAVSNPEDFEKFAVKMGQDLSHVVCAQNMLLS